MRGTIQIELHLVLQKLRCTVYLFDNVMNEAKNTNEKCFLNGDIYIYIYSLVRLHNKYMRYGHYEKILYIPGQ